MRKSTIKLNDAEKSLPSIKKYKTTINSNRTIFKESTSTKLIMHGSPKAKEHTLVGSRESSQRFEAILSKQSKVTHIQPKKVKLNQKITNLIKIIEDQDNYIKTLETEFKVDKDSSLKALKNLSNPLKSEEIQNEIDEMINKEVIEEFDPRVEEGEENVMGFLREEGTRNKHKDLEIYKLKKQLEEDKLHIFKLSQDNSALKKKQSEYEEALAVINKAEKEIEEIKSMANNQVKKLEVEISDIETDLTTKTLDIQEIAELLKRSEEKRTYNNEYNIFMEKNTEKLKDRVAALAAEKAQIQKQIQEVHEKMANQERIIEELQGKIKETQEGIQEEKIKNTVISSNYEASKKALKESTELYEMQKLKFNTEKESLIKTVQDINYEKSELNSSESVHRTAERNTMTEMCKDESVKWQQKCVGLEKELSMNREELEKLKKNEIYLQNQLLTKDLMISQIESLLKQSEEAERKLEQKSEQEENPRSSSLSELVALIFGITDRYTVSKEELMCGTCEKLPTECFVAVPCGHLSCSACKNKSEGLCSQCSEKISGMIHSVNMDRIIYNFKKEMETIERAKKMLRVPNF